MKKKLPRAVDAARAALKRDPTRSEAQVWQRWWRGERPLPLFKFGAVIENMDVTPKQALQWMKELNKRRTQYLNNN